MVTDIGLDTWVGIAVAVILFWGIASWALIRTLRQEDRKIDLIERQKRLETYSPKALADLREWIMNNPNDPDVERARSLYNETVETLRSTDARFYDWSESEVESLERL